MLKGVQPYFNLECAEQKGKGPIGEKVSSHSFVQCFCKTQVPCDCQPSVYCRGVADGLLKLARQEKKQETRLVLFKEAKRLENALVAEEQERKKAIDRLQGVNTSDVKKELSDDGPANVKLEREEETIRVKVEEVPDEAISAERYNPHDNSNSSSDDDDDDGFAEDRPGSETESEAKPDFKDEGDDQDWMLHDVEDGDIKPDPVECKKEETPWTSAQQLALFRNNASTIADVSFFQKLFQLLNLDCFF